MRSGAAGVEGWSDGLCVGEVEGVDLDVVVSRCALMRSSSDPRDELVRSEMLGEDACGMDSIPVCGPIWLPILAVPLRLPLPIWGDCGNVPRENEL